MASPYTQKVKDLQDKIAPVLKTVVQAAIDEAAAENNRDEKEETAMQYVAKRRIVYDGQGRIVVVRSEKETDLGDVFVLVDFNHMEAFCSNMAKKNANADAITQKILNYVPRYELTYFIDMLEQGEAMGVIEYGDGSNVPIYLRPKEPAAIFQNSNRGATNTAQVNGQAAHLANNKGCAPNAMLAILVLAAALLASAPIAARAAAATGKAVDALIEIASA